MRRDRQQRRRFRPGWLAVVLLVLLGGTFMLLKMPGTSHRGPLPPSTPVEAELRERLREHVTELAEVIGERNVWHPAALERAAGYLAGELGKSGFRVAEHPYRAEGRIVRNLAAELPGTGRGEEIVVVGAHYDSVLGSPGANDNGSGAAALLEIARLLAGSRPERTGRFVLFVTEEPPFFQTELMGSRVYAEGCRQRREKIVAMLSLETLGCYRDEPGSQAYPFPLSLFYPDRADFVGFVANYRSRAILRRALAEFRRTTPFPAEGLAAPVTLMGIDWSDHWAFWQAGYPALMVTDTALFRYPHYHQASDTPDKVDYDRLARVTGGLARVVAALATP